MRILIPVKPLATGKSRLAPVAGNEVRAVLCESLLRRTLAVAMAVAPTALVTPDSRVAGIAAEAGARALLEPTDLGLNQALDWARGQLGEMDRLLVLHADLPLLSPAALRSLCADRTGVTIATDRRGTGTNALALPAPVARRFGFAFGEGSAEAHRDEAYRLGAPVRIVQQPDIAFDLDLPGDYLEFIANGGGKPWSAIEKLLSAA